MEYEEFIKPSIKRRFLKSLAEMHKVELDGLERTPVFERLLKEKSFIRKAEEKARRMLPTYENKKMLEDIISMTTDEEIGFLRSVLPADPKSVVLSHNDLYSLNVLIMDKTDETVLIDFEFADYNYRGYDLASIFNEIAFDYDSAYPFFKITQEKYLTEQEVYEFIEYYLFFAKFDVEGDELDQILEDEASLRGYVEKNYQVDKFKEEIDLVLQEVRACSLFTHYYWIIWRTIMSKDDDSKDDKDAIDHIPYAHKRYELYQKEKEMYFKHKA